jgi:hypothetical protein
MGCDAQNRVGVDHHHTRSWRHDDTSKATADELRAMWGPMAANAGTYEVLGNFVTIRPIVAKIPIVMKPSANEVYVFRVEGNTLSLTQQRNARGVTVQNAATTRLMCVDVPVFVILAGNPKSLAYEIFSRDSLFDRKYPR